MRSDYQRECEFRQPMRFASADRPRILVLRKTVPSEHCMLPSSYPIEAFGNLWEILCCSATLVAATFAFLFSPR
jgi:hypothetical protein